MASIILRRLAHALVEKGPAEVCRMVFRKLTPPLRRSRKLYAKSVDPESEENRPVPPAIHPFDVEYGTDTSGLISGEKLTSGSRNDLWNTAYYGVSPSGFNQMMTALALDWSKFTFLDLGSGKGRALLLASRFPFRKIVGVEIAPELSKIAAENVEKFAADWQQCQEIEVHTGDAAVLHFPAGPIVVYFYHPFLGPVLKRCLANLQRSFAAEPREIYVLYAHPMFEQIMRGVPWLVRLWERKFELSEEDRQADRLGAKADWVMAYRARTDNQIAR